MPGRNVDTYFWKLSLKDRMLCEQTYDFFGELNEDTFHLEVNDSIIIPLDAKHRLGNPGSEVLIIFEIQFGKLLDENDIFRHEDLYGRR